MNQSNLPKTHYAGTVAERTRQNLQSLLRAITLIAMYLFIAGPGRLMRSYLEKKKANGEKIWLDTFTFGAKRDPAFHPAPEDAADLSPNREVKSRKSRIIKHDGYPEPEYGFAYKNPPLSGNVSAGLGESTYRRAKKIFHTMDYTQPWGGMEFYLHMTNSAKTMQRVLRTAWDNRHRRGLVNPQQQPINDPQAMSEAVKTAALEAGAVMVGITELQDHHIFEGANLPYRYAISIAVTMDREEMLTAPLEPSVVAVMDAYVDGGQIAVDVAARIRALGWDAVAETNILGDESGIFGSTASVIHVPIAIDAGLGQLGKHGSLITQPHGSNVRLSTVLTNLPLVTDEPVDIGVDDFCANCQICVTNCPPHAILDTKQVVRGEERWYVNFDTCVPYFSSHGGCGICIEVCPWSEAGRGELMTEKMLARRESALTAVA